jgi:hypothetical protein
MQNIRLRAIKSILKLFKVCCIFGCEDPIAGIYWMPRGCVCYRKRRLQALCDQHVWKAEPLAGMRPIIEL